MNHNEEGLGAGLTMRGASLRRKARGTNARWAECGENICESLRRS